MHEINAPESQFTKKLQTFVSSQGKPVDWHRLDGEESTIMPVHIFSM